MEYFDYLQSISSVTLNEQQLAAASFDKGKALVLSTAGSGKTTVTIARVGRLLYEKKLKNKVLTITFSKMAANDMQNRFYRYFGNQYNNNALFSTIHAFSYSIVRDFFMKKGISFNLLTNNFKVIQEILLSHYSNSYNSYVSDEEIENISSAISYVTNMMIDPKNYREHGIEVKSFDKIYQKYIEYKSKNRLIDFDDMLLYSYKIINKSSNYREYIKKSYEYVQIDEMQDTSKIQHELIKIIAEENLFMVGDDDQAIYSFRGSYPNFMLDFKKIYKDGHIFYLDSNYRSDKKIVDGAKRVIEKNKNRYKKEIKAKNQSLNDINIIKVKNRIDQADFIIKQISKTNDKTIGILFRYNMSSMIIANKLYENKINFYLKEDKTRFFNQIVLQDVLSFMYLALNNKDKNSFSKIYYKSYTYFSKEMLNIVLKNNDEKLSVYDILRRQSNFDAYVYDRIDQFKSDMYYLSKLNGKDAIRFIKRDLDYISYLEHMQEEGRTNIKNSLHVLEILEEVGSYCKDLEEFIFKIHALRDVIKDASQNNGSNVTLSTIHSSKGLEYDIVYLIDNTEGEFPQEKTSMPDDEWEKTIEEERRIFYVGVTRAKSSLNIISPKTISMFVEEIQTKSFL